LRFVKTIHNQNNMAAVVVPKGLKKPYHDLPKIDSV
jgi:hypothetical protein